MSLMPYQKISKSFEVKFTKRGYYQILSAKMKTSDIFATVALTTDVELGPYIHVYPAHSRYTDIVAPFSRINGEALRNRFLFEDPFEFRGIRDYSGTDPMKKINWRASARTGDLKVNNYYDTTSRHVTIFLDIVNDLIMRRDDQIEECIRITRNYLEGFALNKVPVHIVTNARDIITGDIIEFGTGLDTPFVNDCLCKLARIDLEKPAERIYRFLEEDTAGDDDLSVLLSVDLTSRMAEAYGAYLGNNKGEWVAPISKSNEREFFSDKFNMTFLEVGR